MDESPLMGPNNEVDIPRVFACSKAIEEYMNFHN
jgi:hypothetical protein